MTTRSGQILALALPEALTEVLKLNVFGLKQIFVQIKVATNALDMFSIKGQALPGADAITIFSAAADFTSPAGLMIDASGDLTTQAVGSGWFAMNVRGLDTVTISAASGNAGGSLIDLFWGGN